jgi:glycosidase
MNILMLAALIGLFNTSCKKSSPKPEPVPVVVTPTDGYKDPAAYGTPFGNVPDTKNIVMYEVNLRSFSQQANLPGATARLDALKALGVNVIWLMPVYPVGQLKSAGGLGSPYSVKDYNAVNSEFGSLDDLRTFVAEAHKRDMAVVLDWVANHTSWDNAWISNKAWYKQDSSGNIVAPPGTGWNDVAQLNFDNNDMRTAMIRAMKYWVLTANVDGYRCDAADFVPTDFWKQAIDTLKKFNNRKLIYLAEGSKKEQLTAGFQMTYAFDFYNSLKGIFNATQAPSSIFTANTNEDNTVITGAYKLRYITNHDVTSSDGSTIDVYKNKQGALAAFVLAAYMGGVPLLYNGQEVGSPKKINFFNRDAIDWTTNPDMLEEYKKLIAFRRSNEAVKTGQLTVYNNSDVIAFEKKAGSDDVLVLVNPRTTAVSYTVPAALLNTNWSNISTNANITLSAQVSIPAYGYLVLKKI